MLSLIRFFRIVPPVPPLMIATGAATVVAGVAAILVNPSRTAGALAPLVVLQVFAASSGFAGPARRGYYDLLWTRGTGRLRMAGAHWMSSVAPGLVGWGILALVETAVRGAPYASLASGTLAAMALVSTLPWAVTTPMPHFAGAIGWLLLLTMVRMLLPDVRLPSAVEFLIDPLTVVGTPLTHAEAWSVAPGLGIGVVAVAAACTWIVRADFPLEAAQ